jgi:hypothetical protein
MYDLRQFIEQELVIQQLDSMNMEVQLRSLESLRRAGIVWSRICPMIIDLLDRAATPPTPTPKAKKPKPHDDMTIPEDRAAVRKAARDWSNKRAAEKANTKAKAKKAKAKADTLEPTQPVPTPEVVPTEEVPPVPTRAKLERRPMRNGANTGSTLE